MEAFSKIAERKIQEAMKAGEFNNLSGAGKPLCFDDETWITEDLRIAYRFLKNSGYIPQELEVRKEIFSLRDCIDSLDDDKERLRKLRELNFKIMKLNMLRKRPLSLAGESLIAEKLMGD
jgi:hypothetical protein